MIQFIKNTRIYKKIFKVNIDKIRLGLNKDLVREMPTEAFLLLQFKEGGFNRYDTIVRYLFIEHYYGKNDFGDALFDKMQHKRIGEREEYFISKEKFIALIKSFEEKGFDPKYALPVTPDLHLYDGSHRLACCLYFKTPTLKIHLTEPSSSHYGKQWFEEHFDKEEVALIEQKKEEIFASIDHKKVLYDLLNSSDQEFGRKDRFYQSSETLGIPGQRPTSERFEIYGLKDILKPDQRALDIGCNCGFFALEIARHVKSMDGIEIATTLVDVGKVAANHLGQSNCHFYNTGFNDFPFTEKYDVIFSFAVHFWIGGSIRKYAQKLDSLLNPGGTIVFESQNIETVDKDFDDKVAAFTQIGFSQISSGSLRDDNTINRRFVILKK